MEQPVKEIAGVITTLTKGTPDEQEKTLNNYFLPNASFSHPFCRVPSFSKGAIPLASGVDSLWVILAIYRWYRTLSPHIDINVDSAVFDQRSGLLYVSLRQTFALWFIPLYKAPVRLVSVLQLTQGPSPESSSLSPHSHHHQLNGITTNGGTSSPTSSPSHSRNGSVSGSGSHTRDNSAPPSPPPQPVSYAAALASSGPERAKYYIASQEDLYPVNDCLQFLLPGLGPMIWFAWQLWSTVLCVAGSLLLLPLYMVLNKPKEGSLARKMK